MWHAGNKTNDSETHTLVAGSRKDDSNYLKVTANQLSVTESGRIRMGLQYVCTFVVVKQRTCVCTYVCMYVCMYIANKGTLN